MPFVHPLFPTREEVQDNPELAFSDHLMIFAEVPVTNDGEPLKIISWNTLGNVGISGIHLQGAQNNDDNYSHRYHRISNSIIQAVQAHDVDVICLQEANGADFQHLRDTLGDDWEYVNDDVIVSFYKKSRLTVNQTEYDVTHRVRTFQFNDELNNAPVTVHNLWGNYYDCPDYIEAVCRNKLNSVEGVSIILGDTNTRIAPLNEDIKNITTGIVPSCFNFGYKVPDAAQITDFPDGGFYKDNTGRIHQLDIQVIVPETGAFLSDEISGEPSRDFRMIACLDESYATKKIIHENTIFEYETYLRNELEMPALLVRVASNSMNERAVGLRFPAEHPIINFLQTELGNEHYQIKRQTTSYGIEETTCFFASDTERLNEALSKYIQTPENILLQLKELTNTCRANVSNNKPAYSVLETLHQKLYEPQLSDKEKVRNFFLYLTENEQANLNVLQNDNSRSVVRYLAGIAAIAAVIATLPLLGLGLIIMGCVYAKTGVLPHHMFQKEGSRYLDGVITTQQEYLSTHRL